MVLGTGYAIAEVLYAISLARKLAKRYKVFLSSSLNCNSEVSSNLKLMAIFQIVKLHYQYSFLPPSNGFSDPFGNEK